MSGRRVAFAAVAWLFLAGVVVQVLFAGASLFELTDWTTHVGFGWLLGSVPIVLLLLAVWCRLERRLFLPTVALTLAAILQPELAAARDEAPVVAALHPLNAMLVFWLAWVVAHGSLKGVGVRPDDEPGSMPVQDPGLAPALTTELAPARSPRDEPATLPPRSAG